MEILLIYGDDMLTNLSKIIFTTWILISEERLSLTFGDIVHEFDKNLFIKCL